MSDDGISFICPAKEEGLHIEETLTDIYSALSEQDYAFEMICIDDGSIDQTHAGMLAFAEGRPEVTVLRFDTNRGLGFAIRHGYALARMPYVMFVPTNGMLDPDSMFHKLGERGPGKMILFDIENMSERPLHRKLPSVTYNYLMTRFFGVDCAYVHAMLLLPRDALVIDDLHADRSFHIVELLVLALRKWKLTPVFRTNRIQRGTGAAQTKSFKLNNFVEIGLQMARLRLRLSPLHQLVGSPEHRVRGTK